ncbi:MAG TPA: fatty acid desaturase [Solirubrobacteraceae bacterium]|nr:fatty acid desaturase [Solirubrobacteraceae bacterium]
MGASSPEAPTPPQTDPVAEERRRESAFWRARLGPYARPHGPRATLTLATSVVPYIGVSVAMYLVLQTAPLLGLLLAVPAAAFLVRTFIVFHDCSHGSFLANRRANAWLGTVLGLFLYSPFVRWQHDHAVHHASSGDLDRRGVGDIHTLTVAEYRALSPRGRLGYRLGRNPLVMLGLGPIVAMMIGPRIVAKGARPRMRRSVLGTDLALALLVGALLWLIGWRSYLLVCLLPAMLAGAAGIWLFYVQHQFEDAYWESSAEWSYADAALRGSSFLKLPPVLRFCTGNIGFHHVHHLNAKIPSYNLPRAHYENAIFRDVPVLSLGDGLRALSLKLWDENSRRLVTFAQARDTAPSPVSSAESA